MNQAQFIKAFAEKYGLTNDQAHTQVTHVLETIREQVSKTNEEVSFAGFGKFYTTLQSSRMGRNPKTGKPLEIKERLIVRFKAGKTLKDATNS
jgi:DNA-binding protein HU-beta